MENHKKSSPVSIFVLHRYFQFYPALQLIDEVERTEK